jgi:hypothetical protein
MPVPVLGLGFAFTGEARDAPVSVGDNKTESEYRGPEAALNLC